MSYVQSCVRAFFPPFNAFDLRAEALIAGTGAGTGTGTGTTHGYGKLSTDPFSKSLSVPWPRWPGLYPLEGNRLLKHRAQETRPECF